VASDSGHCLHRLKHNGWEVSKRDMIEGKGEKRWEVVREKSVGLMTSTIPPAISM
jgi:hypothetical protein